MRVRPLQYCLPLFVGLLTTGCITSDTLLRVKPSGAGTMEMTILVNTAMFKELGGMMGGETTSKGKSGMPSPEELSKQLSQMKGVRLVSQEKITRGDAEGAKVVVAFDDINQISVSEGLPGKEFKPKPEEEVTFRMSKLPNGNSLLSIAFPDKPAEAAEDAAAAKAKQNRPRQNQPRDRSAEKPDPEMLKMMAAFFKDMRVTIAVDVDGSLVKTSSPYVEGNRVTLLDLDLGQLLADPAALEKMESLPMGPDMSLGEVRTAMERAGVKGVKVNEPKLSIEFR